LLKKILKILNKYNSFHILTHKAPDGDALGSSFGLCHAIQTIGKKSQVICEIPEKFMFLCENTKNQIVHHPEIIICVDLPDEKLVWPKEKYKNLDVCIDHHAANKNYAKITYNNPKAAANTENVYELIKLMNIKIDSVIADCIYTGIVTDTGRFKFSNVTSRTFQITSEILPKISNFEFINRTIFDNRSKNYLMIESEVVKNCEFYFDDKCVLLIISRDLMSKFNVKDEEISELTSIPMKISNVQTGVIIKEKEKNSYKVSIRTSNKSANKICQEFYGGGHDNAAAFEISGNLTEVKKRILKVIKIFIVSKN
jgi:phosphoesterase RecJ-like protein